MNIPRHWRFLAILSVVIPGCSIPFGRKGIESRQPLYKRFPTAAVRNGRGIAPLWSDPVARSIGDLVTVVIREKQVIKSGETSETSKSTVLKGSLDNIDIKPDLFKTLPGLGVSSERGFKGKGTLEKAGFFETRLTATVVDVFANHNLAIEGRRMITVDDEEKVIVIRGVVRSCDIAGDNTVLSELVAGAEVSYEGTGPMSRTTRKGFFGQVVDFLLNLIWPF